jgi:hypothetical protein
MKHWLLALAIVAGVCAVGAFASRFNWDTDSGAGCGGG